MSFSKNDFDKLDLRLKKITEQMVEQIEINSELPPTIEQLEDNNKTYSIMAAILFIDIRKSTYLTENSQAKSMVKIYRSFMRMAVDCVRKSGGVTRQFLGDRIMGVFIDSVDKNGNIVDITVSLLVLPRFLGVTGVWLAVPFAELFTLMLTVYLLCRHRKQYHYF